MNGLVLSIFPGIRSFQAEVSRRGNTTGDHGVMVGAEHPDIIALAIGSACELQGLPPDFLDKAPLTVAGKIHCVCNGVPMATGRAIAGAVRRAMAESQAEA